MCKPSNPTFVSVQNPFGVDPANSLVNNVTNSEQQQSTQWKTGSSKSRKHHPHIFVEHHYHDHANDAEAMDDRPAKGGVTVPFPIRLHQMLDKMEADGRGDIISWQPHGRCFVVRKPKEFKELLPSYFKLSKMASFQRQLNLYGFQRLTRGKDKNGYYHEYFLRGKIGLSNKIQRTKVKGTGVRARSSPATEPHLWELPWVTNDGEAPRYVHSQYNSDCGSVTTQEDESESALAIDSPAAAINSKVMPPLVLSSSAATLHPQPARLPFLAMPAHQPTAAPSQTTSTWSIPSKTSMVPPQPMEEAEMDTVLSFGGKSFHYLDPREVNLAAHLRKKQENDIHNFMNNLELDNLFSGLDDENMDNDDKFMTMLERVVL